MENNLDLLKEYATLAGKEDAKSEERKQEILVHIKNHATEDDRKEAQTFIFQKMEHLKNETVDLLTQVEAEDYKLLPLRYIAQVYFGKSAAWLSQRLNGSDSSLNEEQKSIFNHAVKEIGQRIISLQLA